jgi:site-specific DNA recombinase
MRAAIYARVSTERQERQQTIDSQLAALSTWAEQAGHGLMAEHVFRDEGYSGARLDRPGLDALRDAVRDAEVDIVAVLSPDRLARKYAYQALILEEFRRAGCAIEFLHHRISDDPGDQLLLQIQGAVAEYERALLSERFRRGKLQKARAGWFIGGRAPYGYRYLPRRDGAGGRLEIDDAEAEFVRMLYGWLVDERMTIRQILKRLNFGPWYPRSGRHPWSPSVVHHILSEPTYTGTAYANRYDFVEARKPRSRKPGYAGKGCRRLRPREQWIAIPVPPIIDRELRDRAQAQLARNAQLSFRNNRKHNHLLRCLLTCGACGLAMHGVARVVADGTARSTYRCAGKDRVMTARETACPRAQLDGDRLEAAVWSHVRALLADPERLLAQFERFASGADRDAQHAHAAEQRILTRLDRLARADRRLVDAYQAEVISLEELTERRRALAEQRDALEHQRRQQQELRGERIKAQVVLGDLSAFCARIRGRLDEASFADKQAILRLVVERIIVHESSLEIRHVVPLRSPPPGRSGPADEPHGRLRSDRVHRAPLPGSVEDPRDGRLEPGVRVGDHQLHAVEPAALQAAQELHPEGLGLGGADGEADDLAPPAGVDRHGNYGGDRDDPAALADLEVGGVEPEVGPLAGQRAFEEVPHPLVDLLAELRDRALGDPRQPHGLDQIVDAPGADAGDPGFLDHRHQRFLRGPARLEEAREVGALTQLRHAQVQRPQPGLELAVAVTVAPGEATVAALVAAGADQTLDIVLHQELENGLGDRAEEIPVILLLQQLDQRHAGVGHRGLPRFVVDVGKLHHSRCPRWPPWLATPPPGGELPPRLGTLPAPADRAFPDVRVLIASSDAR